MARAFFKLRVHHSGGAANVVYICREMERDRDTEAERGERFGETVERDGLEQGDPSDDDPVWTWNAPEYVTGDCYGVAEGDPHRAALEGEGVRALTPSQLGMAPARGGPDFSVAEKRERGIAHFSVLADLEELRGGPTHLRIVLSVGPGVTNRALKAMVNAFLGENFPLNPALVSIHRDTNYAHAHVYVHLRQIDDRRVRLGQKYFHLDESWMRVCSEHLRDEEIYKAHMEMKAATLEWKGRAEKAREKGKPLPQKPDRWADHHDTRLVFRPYDDRWCGRLQAQTRVAETKVKWLGATKARAEQVESAREDAHWLRERLERAAGRRAKGRSESKRAMPAEVITVSEARDLLRYDRDIQRAEKGRGTRPKRAAPAAAADQGALRFDGPTTEPVKQIGFDFGGADDTPREPHSKQAQVRTHPAPPVRGREASEAPTSVTAATPTEADGAALALGRELVAEARHAHTKSCLSTEKSAKERRRLKDLLIKNQREHALARNEADVHRSVLVAQGAAEPPYLLTEDERSYLRYLSTRVPEELRNRITTQVARAHIISDREGAALKRRAPEPAAAVEALRPVSVRAEPSSRPAAAGVKDDENPSVGRVTQTPEVQPAPAAPAVHPEIAAGRGAAHRTMPDGEVSRLRVLHALAQAHLAALRAAEADFNAAPHLWVSPTSQCSLADVEKSIAQDVEAKRDVRHLLEVRERVREDLAAERARLPFRIREVEEQARPLAARMSAEKAARDALGLALPDPEPTAAELREYASHAAAARDASRLRQAFQIGRAMAVREAGEGKSGETLRLLEEWFAGAHLVAEVRAHRSAAALTLATEAPGKVPLPATDDAGRDTVATLEQAGGRKWIRAALGWVVGSGDRYQPREQLLKTKDGYIDHLRTDAAARESFLGAARDILRECRELARGAGYHAPAVPELTHEQIREVRAYAVTLEGGPREGWLADCTRSQKLKDERAREAAEARGPRLAPYDETRHRQQWEESLKKEVGEMIARSQDYVRQQAVRQKPVPDRPGSPERSAPEPQREKGRSSRSR